uniref:Uncharacterized protein n=1 Tax=Octopus bimaculoides TaxID=37653 RepID=A0A0L8FGF2_OCTBM
MLANNLYYKVIYFVCMSMCCVYSKWYVYSKVSVCSMCDYDVRVCICNMHVCKQSLKNEIFLLIL